MKEYAYILDDDDLVEVIDRLKGLGLSSRVVAERTGLGIQWVAKFRQHRIPEPGAFKLGKIIKLIGDVHRERLSATGSRTGKNPNR